MTAADATTAPVYLRLRDLLAEAILIGEFGEGAQLPSVRTFAAAHGATPLTVAKAYQTLQDEGFVAVRRGIGMFVATGAVERLRVQEREHFLHNVWPRMRAHIERLGIDPAQLVERNDA